MIYCQVFVELELGLITDGTVAYSREISIQEQQSRRPPSKYGTVIHHLRNYLIK